jgi:hypothetical protein
MPEILCAVSFLSTRVQCANMTDWLKFIRVCKFLNNKDLEFTIKFGDPNAKELYMDAFIDASYAVHPNGKSHSGAVLRIMNGPIDVQSSKQKINTKSSAEAELVALSDKSGSSLMYREYLVHQGYDVEAITIHEDNQSTIALINKGHSTSERTRHINIRYFFLKDRIDSGEIKIDYIQTEEMIADILTKPLQGKLFIKLRNLLRGFNN